MAEIRDRRHASWFWMDKGILDTYGARLGVYGIAVYAYLARCADSKGTAFPSLGTIAKTLGVSRRKIIQTIEDLIDTGVIDKGERLTEYGDNNSNLYSLLDIGGSAPHAPPSAPHAPPSAPHAPRGSAPHAPPSAPHAPEQDPINKIQEEQEEDRRTNVLLRSAETSAAAGEEWPAEFLPLLEWLTTQDLLTRITVSLNFEWWSSLSYVVNGLPTPEWLSKHFSKMQMWLKDNPKRCPTPRGTNKFIAGWLERAYEEERTHASYAKKALSHVRHR